MTKSLTVNPDQVRAAGVLTLPEIPINAWTLDWDAELAHHGADGLVAMLVDMIAIREFETMLNSIKTTGAWQGIEYNHRGPAHLSMGQEAAVVGQAAELDVDDQLFGSHRSHGEILAKSFSAARQMDSARLTEIMTTFLNGDVVKMAEKIPHDDDQQLARNFILFGTLAEVFARSNGVNRGMGGSMHAFLTPFGSMPNNAIVGGSAPIAQGAALFKRINEQPGIVIANIGDASMGCGPVWEAMTFAAMDQFHTLWRDTDGGHPPIMFNFMNNFYGMGGQTSGETMGYEVLARVGAGVNPEAMHAERVDGYSPLAMADATRRKKELLLAGKGPVLLDTITYRYSGHSPSDASSYRTRDEVEAWQAQDSINAFAELLTKHKLVTAGQIEDVNAATVENLTRVLALATDEDQSPRVDLAFIESVILSNQKVESFDPDRKPELSESLKENARVQSIEAKVRSTVTADGTPVSKNKMYQFRDGLFEAMAHRFATDSTMAAWGEENRDWGGAFAVYRGLTELLPYRRLFNSPISEAAIIGAGVGYALAGGRAVVELMYCDFLGRAGDEVFNQAAKWQAMSAGQLKMPLVMRVSVGNKYGAQHSQDWSALVNHIPGLKVYFPASPADAKGMLNLALAGTDPVVFLESQLLYDIGEQFSVGGVPEGYYETPEGEPIVRREGKDVTIATLGATLYRALEAADTLSTKYGIEAEVIDLRFVTPFNPDLVVESVRKTGRLVLSSDAVERGSAMQTIATTITDLAFDSLDAPVTVVGARNHVTPAPELEDLFFPQPGWIIDAIHERIVPLVDVDGHPHVPASNQTLGDLARRSREGV